MIELSSFHSHLTADLKSSFVSYPKIYNLGHSAINEIFLDDDLIVQEKVDGSQISFGRFGSVLRVRSKGQEIDIENPPKMFSRGIEVLKKLAPLLTDGWTYRGEYLEKPKHNTLAYDRIPLNHIILFDINTGPECYLPYYEVVCHGTDLGFEVVPRLSTKKIESIEEFQSLLAGISVLGGQHIEGVVVKNYKRFGVDKKALMGKYVSERFKELHHGDWKERNPAQGDVIQLLVGKYKTPARWEKAVQHLKESGILEDSPKDIGLLIKEVSVDLKAECESEIKQQLFTWAWDKMHRQLTAGLPEWYKTRLLEKAFGKAE